MSTETLDRDETPVRMTRGFRRLQSVVNRYLNDSGSWIENVKSVIDELIKFAAELERREQAILSREAKLDQREAQLDALFEGLISDAGLKPAKR